MDGCVGRAASVRHRGRFARDTDVGTIRRYEHTEMKSDIGELEWLGEMDGGRVEDVQMAGVLGAPFILPTRYRESRWGGDVDWWSVAESLARSDRGSCYRGWCI